jgi:uncharacterized protein (DUF58 family)
MLDPVLFKKIKRLEIVSRHLVEDQLSGNYLSTFQGQGLEFSEVREYFPGDEVRRIDWNVTARMQKPFVKVFQEERELTVLFAVDVSSSTEFGSKGSSKRELAAQLVAALGFAAVSHGDRVGFVLFTDRMDQALPPRKGKTHLLRAVRDILSRRAEGRGTSLAAAAAALPSLARRRAVVFLISDFLAADPAASLKAAARRFDLIACRLSDKAEENLVPGLGLVPARDPESGKRYWLDADSGRVRRAWSGAFQKQKQSVEKELKRMRCDWFDVRTGEDFIPPMMRFFKLREKRKASGR